MTVHYLDPDRQCAADVQEVLVKELEGLLERARAGELKSFIGCGHLESGDMLSCQLGVFNWRLWETVGMLESLKYDCLATFDQATQKAVRRALEASDD